MARNGGNMRNLRHGDTVAILRQWLKEWLKEWNQNRTTVPNTAKDRSTTDPATNDGSAHSKPGGHQKGHGDASPSQTKTKIGHGTSSKPNVNRSRSKVSPPHYKETRQSRHGSESG